MGRKLDKRIDELCDERGGGGDWFVYLKPGYRLGDAHCFGEETLGEVRASMKLVVRCDCEECRSLKAQAVPARKNGGAEQAAA